MARTRKTSAQAALLMTVVMCAVATSSASARSGELISDGPVTLNMLQLGAAGSGANALTAFGAKIECPASSYKGHKYDATPHALVDQSGSTAITVTPSYVNCFAEPSGGGAFSTTIDMNGCDFVMHIGEATEGEHTFDLTTDIVCPKEASINITVFLGGAHSIKVCTSTIKPQSGLTGANVITNTATHELNIKGTIKNLFVKQSGICGSQETSEGEFDIDLTVRGRDEAKEPTGITVVEEPGPNPGSFTSDGPVTLLMTEKKENALTMFNIRLGCPGSSYTGHKVIAPIETEEEKEHELIEIGSNSATITPYINENNCNGAENWTVDINGCDYVLRIGEEEGLDTYGITTEVVCPGSQGIQFRWFTSSSHFLELCTLTILPQGGISGAQLVTNTGTGDLSMIGTFTGIQVKQSGPCGTSEGFADWHTDLTIKGLNLIGSSTEVTVTS